MEFSPKELDAEAARLHSKMGQLGWNLQNCVKLPRHAKVTLSAEYDRNEQRLLIRYRSGQVFGI